MAEENSTVAGILKRVRRECNSYPLPNAAGEKLKLVREIEDAHKSELAEKDAELAAKNRQLEVASVDAEAADAEIDSLSRKIAAKDAEIARLVDIINTEVNKCGDCAKFGNDCNAGDIDGNENCRACKKFVSKEVARLRALVAEIARGFIELEKAARFKEYGGRGVRFSGSVTTAFWHQTADIAKKARKAVKNEA